MAIRGVYRWIIKCKVEQKFYAIHNLYHNYMYIWLQNPAKKGMGLGG